MDGVLQPLHTVEPQARSCGIQVAEGRDTLPNAVREMLSPDKVGADDELTECLRTIVLLQRQHSPTQRRRNQLSTIRPDELCSLRQHANEVQWQEVRFVNHLLESQQLILVITGRLDYPKHLLYNRAGQVAGRGQLQSTDLVRSLKQEQRIGRDRRSGDFRIGVVRFEADRVVTSRRLVTKSIQAVEFKHRPGRFGAIEPSTNLRILEESWCNHDTAYPRSLKFRQLRHGRQVPRRWARAEMRLRQFAN